MVHLSRKDVGRESGGAASLVCVYDHRNLYLAVHRSTEKVLNFSQLPLVEFLQNTKNPSYAKEEVHADIPFNQLSVVWSRELCFALRFDNSGSILQFQQDNYGV